jgi:chemotaxis protein methyltransferase CheR
VNAAALTTPPPGELLGGPLTRPIMKDKEFKRFSEFIYSSCGIKMPPSKRTLLESRLHKRLRALSMTAFAEYCDYVFSPEGMEAEVYNLIDVVTTNTTEFFREPNHFEILNRQALPAWLQRHGLNRSIRLWSAGCSSGEEPYTLAMVLSEFAKTHQGFKFQILATDISAQILSRAASAIYPEERLGQTAQSFKKKYFLQGKGRFAGMVRVAPELRAMVTFDRLNFMDEFHFKRPHDIIFCRNVMIYFDRQTQENLLNKFCRNLAADGYLFMGHSESISGMELPLRQVAPTVYQLVDSCQTKSRF